MVNKNKYIVQNFHMHKLFFFFFWVHQIYSKEHALRTDDKGIQIIPRAFCESSDKTEYIEYDFNKKYDNSDVKEKITDQTK